jgi:hypothetical protein
MMPTPRTRDDAMIEEFSEAWRELQRAAAAEAEAWAEVERAIAATQRRARATPGDANDRRQIGAWLKAPKYSQRA